MKKFYLIILLINFKVTFGNIQNFKTTTNNFLYIATVNSSTSLNVRSQPKLDSNRIDNIKTGKKVKVLERSEIYLNLKINNKVTYGQWVLISYKKQGKLKKGYVYDYFLSMDFDMKKLGYSKQEMINNFKKNKNCVIDNISKNFIFSLDELLSNEGRRIRLEIQGITEENTTFQRMDFQVSFLNFKCSGVNYFEIKKNKTPTVIGEKGNLIVWDFNLDGLEDIAIKIDNGGNYGSWYSFYMQQKNGSFKKEEFPFSLLPTEIDFNKKTITQIHPVGCCKYSGATYKREKNKWIEVEVHNGDIK